MVWSKTDAGRQEIKARSQVTGRARRTLLLLVDGKRGEGELLAAVAGTTPADFDALAALGMIAMAQPADAQAPPAAASPAGVPVPVPVAAPAFAETVDPGALSTRPDSLHEPAPASRLAPASAPVTTATPSRYAHLSRALTEMIASELGFRGFVLTMAVEKASTFDDLRTVAERVITAIGDRKGPAQARAAHRTLFGE